MQNALAAWLTDADVLEPIEDQPLVHLVCDAHPSCCWHRLATSSSSSLENTCEDRPPPERPAQEQCERTARAGAKGLLPISLALQL